GKIHGVNVSLAEVAELTPVIAALATLADGPSQLRGVGHIRHHETDRLAALGTELSGLGADVSETPDGLAIAPKPLTGKMFGTYDDHRMAHAAAVIGLRVPDVTVDDVSCTAKTLPAFPRLWAELVASGEEG
ncbi:MAG TPA: hypothetical protein VF062_15215, partial [Candidatus Limnocylindrales bacterium]